MIPKNLRFSSYSGHAIRSIIPELGRLRIAVFYDYPYLYEGTASYEEVYLERYAAARESFVFAVFDEEQLIGATTCMPLHCEDPEIRAPFEQQGFDLRKIMYFGESILLPDYRGYGLGHRFFDEREAFTRDLNTHTTTAFCSVLRPENHPLRPSDYRSNHAFWTKRGYTEYPELNCRLSWPDRGETEATEKTLSFWLKHWS